MTKLDNAVSVHVDAKDLARLERELRDIPDGVRKAMVASINRTLRTGKTMISRSIRNEIALPAADVNAAIVITKRASRAAPGGQIKVSRKAVALKRYGARAIQRGVSVRVRRKSSRERLFGAFISEPLGGHVFERDRRADGTRVGRLPISKKFGPTVQGVLGGKPRLLKTVLRDLGAVLRKNLLSQTDRLLKRSRK